MNPELQHVEGHGDPVADAVRELNGYGYEVEVRRNKRTFTLLAKPTFKTYGLTEELPPEHRQRVAYEDYKVYGEALEVALELLVAKVKGEFGIDANPL